MANIYQLSQQLLAIFNEVEENEGELTPELEKELDITRESFKEKIKDYSNVVKMLQNDIVDIKTEKTRLNDLQKSKEKTIERLKKIMIEAIDLFGETTKTGGKFIDYGTGKVSIKNTQIVEIDKDNIDTFVNSYISVLSWYDMQNQLSRNIVNSTDLLDFANQSLDDDGNLLNLNFSMSDVEKLDANIDLKVSIKDLLESETGFELAKALIRFGQFNINTSVDKNDIKREAKEKNVLPSYATIVENKSVIIK